MKKGLLFRGGTVAIFWKRAEVKSKEEGRPEKYCILCAVSGPKIF